MQDQIVQALRRNAADEAVQLARQWLASAPDDAQAYRWLASALRQQGDTGAALDNNARAIALDPENAELHLERAGLLLGERQLGEAQAALARATGLDPNQFQAYVAQAHLALSRGDLDEAARLSRLAARVSPDDPQLGAIDGTLALRGGEPERALAILARANERLPDDPLLLHGLGFAYMAAQNWAFAEQAFRRTMELNPAMAGLQTLVALLALRQNRPGDAIQAMDALLAEPGNDTPAIRRLAGEIRLQAGDPGRAVPYLKQALAATPGDRRTLQPLLVAWQRLGALDDARATLEAALATHSHDHELWLARVAVEEELGGDALGDIVGRWNAAMPDHVPALEAQMRLHDLAGETDAAGAVARRIAALDPYRPAAAARVVEALLQRDPDQAVVLVEGLLDGAPEPARPALRQWLGIIQDRAGRPADALATWTALQASQAAQRLPLPPPSEGAGQSLPPLAEVADPDTAAAGPILVWGAPGSGVERLVVVLEGASPFLRRDRFGPNPPADALQRYATIAELAGGRLDPAAMIAGWRAQLPHRGLPDGRVIDWLLWWDNALLPALRAHLPEGRLLLALRDPRDMLLEWIAFGAPLPVVLESPQQAADWLAAVLEQVAVLIEQDLYPHGVIRLDGIETDPQALAAALESAFGGTMRAPVPPGVGPQTLQSGHWRAYTEVLAGPFAALAPVAVRLGYPEA